MVRLIIMISLGLVGLGAIFVARPTVETASAMVLMARDIFFPSEDNVKKGTSVASTSSPAKAAPLSDFAAKFGNNLMIMDDEKPKSFEATRLAGVKYYAFYYSASWCAPCRAFTPDLVRFYRTFKPSHPEFELIFVNLDRSENDMLSYMNSDSMQWPAIWYADIDNPEIEAKKYCGEGIPCLVLVDDRGRVLSDTYVNGQYTDPHHVIDDIRAVMP